MSVQTDLEFHSGENWIVQYECNDGSGNDINLTGAELEWALATLDSTVVMTCTIGDGITLTAPLEGSCTLSVTPAHQTTAGITAGTTYRWELRLTTASGTISVQGEGKLAVLPSLLS